MSAFKIEATNDILGDKKEDLNFKGAGIRELEQVLEYIRFEDKISKIFIMKEDGSTEFVDLSYENGTYTLMYGDGKNEYWTFNENEPSSVTEEEALEFLRNFVEGKEYREKFKWFFFQEQYTGKGCLLLIGAAVLSSHLIIKLFSNFI